MLKNLLLQDPEGSSFLRKEKILYILFTVFFVTLYLPGMPVINNIAIGMLCLGCLLYNSVKEKRQLLRQRPAVFLMVLFYILNIVSTCFSRNVAEGFSWVGMRVPLLLFPASVGLIYLHESLKDRILFLYTWATIAAAAVCLAWALVVYNQTNDAGSFYNDSLSDAIGKQSIYFAMMINIALFGILHLLFKGSDLVKQKTATFMALFFLLMIHFLLASRAAIIILYAGTVIYAGYYFFVIRKKSWLWLAGIPGAVVLIVVVLVTVFPKTMNRFREMQYTGYTFNSHAAESHYNMELTPDQWNGTNVRLAIWKCGWELAQQHLLWGVTLGDKHAALLDTYRARHFDFGIQTNKNMHNNYLDVLSSLGIIGLLVMLAGFFIMPLAMCFKAKDAWGIFVITAFALSLVTETYMDHSIGSVLLGLFIPFITAYKQAVR